jgi:hypothetical protein
MALIQCDIGLGSPDKPIQRPVAMRPDTGFILLFGFELYDPFGTGQGIGHGIEGKTGDNISTGHVQVSGKRPQSGDSLAKGRNVGRHVDGDTPLDGSRSALGIESGGFCNLSFITACDVGHFVQAVFIDSLEKSVPHRTAGDFLPVCKCHLKGPRQCRMRILVFEFYTSGVPDNSLPSFFVPHDKIIS